MPSPENASDTYKGQVNAIGAVRNTEHYDSIQDCIDVGGGVVKVATDQVITSMLTVKEGVKLLLNPSAAITSSSIQDMVLIHKNSEVTGGAIINTNVNNTGALIKLDESFQATRRDDRASVHDIRLQGPQRGGGNGDSCILATLSAAGSYIQWAQFYNIQTSETEYGIRHKLIGGAGALKWINSLVYNMIGMDQHQRHISIELDATDVYNQSSQNIFDNMYIENGCAALNYPERRMVSCNGDRNYFNIVSWDWTSSGGGIAIDFGTPAGGVAIGTGNRVWVTDDDPDIVADATARNFVTHTSREILKEPSAIIVPSCSTEENPLVGASGGLVDDFLVNGLDRGMVLSAYSGPSYPESRLPRIFKTTPLAALWGLSSEKVSGPVNFELDLNGTYSNFAAAGFINYTTTPVPRFKLETYYSGAWHDSIDIRRNMQRQCWGTPKYNTTTGVSKLRVTLGASWVSGIVYEIGDVVLDDTGTASGEGRYICIGAHTSGATMLADTAYWTFFSIASTSSIGIVSLFLLKGDSFGKAWAPSFPLLNELITTPITINANQQQQHFTNEGATAAVHIDLPAATIGLEFSFSRVAAYDMNIDPNGSELFSYQETAQAAGGEALLDAANDFIYIKCFAAGVWSVLSSSAITFV